MADDYRYDRDEDRRRYDDDRKRYDDDRRRYDEDEIPDSVELKERKRVKFFGLPFSFTKYILKANKLVVRSGFFTTVEDEILLYRVLDVTMRRTLGQKLNRLGTLRIISSDKSIPDLEIRNIKHYRQFKDELSERVAKERMRMRTRTSEMVNLGLDGDDDDYRNDMF